ncbi:MAG: hypothetical protein Q4P31_00265 [Andreesenia angusta]|nr:hypothetical protein [Andreesenia angusta]
MIDILYEKIEIIKNKYKPKGIILIGSFVEEYEDYIKNKENYEFTNTSDIDLFIIGDYKEFERSVESYCGIEFDISYINLNQLTKAIEEEIDSLISILAKSKVIESDIEIKDIIENIKKLYMRGPKKMNKYTIDYNRFIFTNEIYQLKKIIEKIEFEFLFNKLLSDLIKFNYHISGKWIPTEKRLLKFIEDSNILYIIDKIYKSNNRIEKLELIVKLFNYIMKDYGGELKVWPKGPYPFDFK